VPRWRPRAQTHRLPQHLPEALRQRLADEGLVPEGATRAAHTTLVLDFAELHRSHPLVSVLAEHLLENACNRAKSPLRRRITARCAATITDAWMWSPPCTAAPAPPARLRAPPRALPDDGRGNRGPGRAKAAATPNGWATTPPPAARMRAQRQPAAGGHGSAKWRRRCNSWHAHPQQLQALAQSAPKPCWPTTAACAKPPATWASTA
jgi:hypothetical protein